MSIWISLVENIIPYILCFFVIRTLLVKTISDYPTSRGGEIDSGRFCQIVL